MIKFFIEAQNTSTPEYNFLKTLIDELGYSSQSWEIIPIGGKDKLHLAKNHFIQNTTEGGSNLIVFDADFDRNGGGYGKRHAEILAKLDELMIKADVFLWPDNSSDGDFETMLESIARKDLHERFFGCFQDYELCLGDQYLCPNLKGKLHTYITAMKLTKRQRDKIGSGHWLFDNNELWDLNSPRLATLKDFITCNFRTLSF